jgi:hypothetical protein
MRLHWNGAGLICHELCHLIHQFALDNGLANATVVQAYLNAKASGRYDKSQRRDWAGQECDSDIAYAMVDHKEFWAEMSVTYLCDTYPNLDKVSMDMCSPPYMDPVVAERVQQCQLRSNLTQSLGGIPKQQLASSTSKLVVVPEKSLWKRFVQRLKECFHPNNKKELANQPCPPCNKFYPFTRGQLRGHDNETYSVINELWREIEQWDDPMEDRICAKGLGGILLAPLLAKGNAFQSQTP